MQTGTKSGQFTSEAACGGTELSNDAPMRLVKLMAAANQSGLPIANMGMRD